MKSEKCIINFLILITSVTIIVASPIKNLSLKHIPSASVISSYKSEHHIHKESIQQKNSTNTESTFSNNCLGNLFIQTNTIIESPVINVFTKHKSLINNIILFDNHRLIVLRI